MFLKTEYYWHNVVKSNDNAFQGKHTKRKADALILSPVALLIIFHSLKVAADR